MGAPVEGRRWWGKWGRRVNTAQKLCTHVCTHVNAKMIPVETIPGMGGGEDKEEQWRG
jgi:hypothetical protein